VVLLTLTCSMKGLFCHRSDLCNELRRVALGQEGIGRPAKLHAGQKALACDPNAGTVTLAGGELIHADVILGAEGIGVRRTKSFFFDAR
jgi:salicylate hydroxylase